MWLALGRGEAGLVGYHQEVRLGVGRVAAEGEDAGAAEVLGQRDAQVGIVEDAEVLSLCGVCDASGAGLDGEVGLAESAALDEDVDWERGSAMGCDGMRRDAMGCDGMRRDAT